MSVLIKVMPGEGRPEGFINSDAMTHAWIEPCYKTDRATFDLSNQLALIIEKDVERDPYAVTDDKKLYSIIEQGIDIMEEDGFISFETKISLRMLLFDRYRRHDAIKDYRLLVATRCGSRLTVAEFNSRESARDGLKALIAAINEPTVTIFDDPELNQ